MGIGGTKASAGASAATIADAVWDELIADHATVLTYGNKFKDTNNEILDLVTDQSERVSTAESITTTETPPAASLSVYFLDVESGPAIITAISFSGNAGTNFVASGEFPAASARGWRDLNATTLSAIPLGAAGRLRWVTPATVGTYIVHVLGASIS